jgi:hypothetical protein
VQLFSNARHLHLESARLGSGFGMALPPARSSASFSSIRHLEVRGCLPDHDAGVIVDAMSGILELAPNLEALSLAFHHQEHNQEISRLFSEEELLDAHHLGYNPHSVLAGRRPPP